MSTKLNIHRKIISFTVGLGILAIAVSLIRKWVGK